MTAVMELLLRHLKAFAIVGGLIGAAYVLNATLGLRAAAVSHGSVTGLAIRAPVEILRDDRGIPHIRARNGHDLYFAQGFVEGSDRLFQMELMRRFVYGQLAEVLGSNELPIDEQVRTIDARDIVERQWRHLRPGDRAALDAFSDGVNAAMRSQPLPIEFRLLLYRPAAWKPRDCLAVGVAISLDLTDSWHSILARNDVWRRDGPRDFDAAFPLSDSKYDVSIRGNVDGPPARPAPSANVLRIAHVASRPIGSNAWAAGARRTATGRALLANDPHLDLNIPGIWYLIDLRAPGLHVAGAAIPGAPGIILGHNERVAWGATNGAVTSMSLFYAGRLHGGHWKRERFHVRFGPDVTRLYYRTPHEFAVPDDYDRTRLVLVRWSQYDAGASALAAILALNRAASARDAVRALATFPGPAQNFVIADTHGFAGYHLAGRIADDAAWGRYVHPARDLRATYPAIAFARLPRVAPSRDAVVLSANNKMYGDRYPYRLSAGFALPYRAYRIARLLRARTTYDVAYFARMQLDTFSPADLEFARDVVAYARSHPGALSTPLVDALARWDGRFTPNSDAATLERRLRIEAENDAPGLVALMNRFRAGRAPSDFEMDLRAAQWEPPRDLTGPWGEEGAVRIEHQFGPLGFAFLDGATLPGDGDEYTVHVQAPGFSQSFRAVWDIGNWDAGGIVIPSGESGEPGSAHYRDLSPQWISGRLAALPFSERAVRAATRERLVLVPSRP
ncbi:MAG TPA: penicillin acylase family protein [Candidatus Baltobacteraceae bacterium]